MKLKIALAAALIAAPAFAQQPPSQDEIVAQYNVETGQLRLALGQVQQQIIAARKQIIAAEARVKELEAKGQPKK
jgi:hypothetical protein